jgi:hypothetical protein
MSRTFSCSSRRAIFFICTTGNDPQHIISGNGLHNALASSYDARIQALHPSTVVRMTGIALGCIGSTIAFGTVARKP